MNLNRLKYLEALSFPHTCDERPWKSSSLQLSIGENNAKYCFPAWEYPSWDILRCSLIRGNTWLQNWTGFPHTHLSDHACVAFQNKQHHYWLYKDLFKTSLRFLTHQFSCFGWKFHPFSWQRDIPVCHGNCSVCSTMCTAASPKSMKQQLLIVALISLLLVVIIIIIISVSFMKWLLLATRRERPNEMAPVREKQVVLILPGSSWLITQYTCIVLGWSRSKYCVFPSRVINGTWKGTVRTKINVQGSSVPSFLCSWNTLILWCGLNMLLWF